MSTLLLACGIQNAYLHPEGSKYMGETSKVMDMRLKSYFKSTKKPETIVYIIREVHQPNDKFFSEQKTGEIVGSKDISIPEFYKAYSKLFINTMRYNALYGTLLESEIYKLKPEKIYLIGFETHTHILFTAEELRNRDYSVSIIEALTCSSDEYLHAIGVTILRNFLNVDII